MKDKKPFSLEGKCKDIGFCDDPGDRAHPTHVKLFAVLCVIWVIGGIVANIVWFKWGVYWFGN